MTLSLSYTKGAYIPRTTSTTTNYPINPPNPSQIGRTLLSYNNLSDIDNVSLTLANLGIDSALADKASTSHTHVQNDVTGLTSALSGKASTSHTHATTDITSGTLATARLGSGTANQTTFLRGDQLWIAPGIIKSLWIPASDMIPKLTNGATSANVSSSIYEIMYDVLEFDQTVAQYAQIIIKLPSNYTGGDITGTFIWTTVDNNNFAVVWRMSGVYLPQESPIDVPRGATQSVSSTNEDANYINFATTPAITIAGAGTGPFVCLEFSRDPDNGSDSLDEKAQLIGVELNW